MCVIIYNPEAKKISKQILSKSAQINPDGAGVYWLDSGKLEYFPSNQFKKLHKARPFIAHFRYATVGAVTKANRQPVEFSFKVEAEQYNFKYQRDYLFFHNGTIPYLGNDKESDSVCMAKNILSFTSKYAWADLLSTYNSRFATVKLDSKSVEIYNRDEWTEHNGVLYSKANVLDSHKVAVYGTLRKGNSNYNYYLTKANYLGQGQTVGKYLMTCPSSIPFVSSKPTTQGSNIVVDVFDVDSVTLANLDRLEGHPYWYNRKQIQIDLDSGQGVTAWLYFNDQEPTTPPYLSDYNTRAKNNFNSFHYLDSEIVEDEQYCIDCYSDLVNDPYTDDPYCPNCYAYSTRY